MAKDLTQVEPAAEMAAITDAMQIAQRHGLECEVIWSALHAIKDNPSIDIADAMETGLDEWDI